MSTEDDIKLDVDVDFPAFLFTASNMASSVAKEGPSLGMSRAARDSVKLRELLLGRESAVSEAMVTELISSLDELDPSGMDLPMVRIRNNSAVPVGTSVELLKSGIWSRAVSD
jgi:hypothetical protein